VHGATTFDDEDSHMSATTLKTAMESAGSARTSVPTGVQLTPFDATFRNDPYHALKRLRDAEPTHRDNALSHWFVTGFDNVREVLRNKDPSNDINRALPDSYAGRIASNAKVACRNLEEAASRRCAAPGDHGSMRYP
jgi:cytochrome P450